MKPVRRVHRNVDSADVDWHQADLSKLFEQIRERFPASEAEKMVWAFERAFEVARVDEQLLEHLLVAAACLVAQTQDVTPRGVFEQFFRRSVSSLDPPRGVLVPSGGGRKMTF